MLYRDNAHAGRAGYRMLYRDNVHAGRLGYQAPGIKSPTQVPTNVHCIHWLPKELSKKGYQTYQGVENH